MTAQKIIRLEKLIAKVDGLHGKSHLSVTWLGPASESRIALAEERLGVTFPFSYRQFLLMTGGGGLDTFWIDGVPPKGNIEHAGSTVGATKNWRAYNGAYPTPEHYVVIQQDDDHNEPFCLDTSKMKQGECPVVLFYPSTGAGEVISKNFIDFYERYTDSYFTA